MGIVFFPPWGFLTGERNVTYAFEGSLKRILQIFIPVPIRLEMFVPIPIRFLLIQLPYFHLLLRQLSLPFDLAPTSIGPAVTLFFPRHGWSVRFIRYWKRLFTYKWDSQLSFHPPFIKLQVSLPGPHLYEELESSTSFRNNFPGMTFPKNRISISLKLSPRKLDCPAFPNYHCLEQPHLPSQGAGFAIFHMYLGTPQLSRNEW